ncbi:fork head domain-containing protein [Colletotrichum limetticola]|uniref:Fork head domain-containing protein n=1 Tax=Colletotrichum limetticola TaxID=1209924 RepID=A0ABQ9PCR4_9PEZI|nr:fork head domain-containing protein [Colletotrichum limetticola]
MTLQEIYQWIQHNTGEDATPSPSTIRYNLSTNKAFVQTLDKRSKWQLSSQFAHEILSTSVYHKQTFPSSGKLDRAICEPTNPLIARRKKRRGDTTDLATGRSVGVMTHVSTSADGDSVCSAPECFGEQLPSVCFQCLLDGNEQCDKKKTSCTRCSELGLPCEEQAPFLKAGMLYLTTLS